MASQGMFWADKRVLGFGLGHDYLQTMWRHFNMNDQCGSSRVHLLKFKSQDFPGGLIVKTSPSNAGGVGLIPGCGARIPYTL